MAEREEQLGSSDVGTARVGVPGSEVAAGGEAKAIAMGAGAEARRGEPLLPLQDLWYYSTSLFLAVGAPEVSPPGVPKKWILKGEAPSHETTWFPAASSIMDLQFQRKKLLLAPIQFLCPCDTTVGWPNWVEQEVADEEFC